MATSSYVEERSIEGQGNNRGICGGAHPLVERPRMVQAHYVGQADLVEAAQVPSAGLVRSELRQRGYIGSRRVLS